MQGFNHFCAYGPEGACGDNTGQIEEQGCVDCEMDALPVVSPLVGLPVSVTTGEMTFTHFDGAVGSLGFSRTYNT